MAFARSLLQKMLLESPSEEHFDVRLVVEGQTPKHGETTLHAHRIVLSTVSSEFRKMFESGLKGRAEGVVRIHDFSAAAVREALSVIYGGELGTAARDWKLAGQVWDFGHRFDIEHVATLARTAALNLVSEENCLRVLGFAIYVGDDVAAEQLKTFIAEPAHFLRAVRSPEFGMASYDVIAALRRPGPGTFVEPDILTFEKVWCDALVTWANGETSAKPAEAETMRVARLTQALRLVDFSRMRTHELREAHRSEAASGGNVLAGMLVGILLSRAEKLEALNFEKDRDIEELDSAYQMALHGKNEADRNARLTSERLEKVASGKLKTERRDEEEKSPRRSSGRSSGAGHPAGVSDDVQVESVGVTFPYMPPESRLSSASYPSKRKQNSTGGSLSRSPIL